MRKKNKNNNENAQMQDMNTVQMDGANAAFAANANFSGAELLAVQSTRQRLLFSE